MSESNSGKKEKKSKSKTKRLHKYEGYRSLKKLCKFYEGFEPTFDNLEDLLRKENHDLADNLEYLKYLYERKSSWIGPSGTGAFKVFFNREIHRIENQRDNNYWKIDILEKSIMDLRKYYEDHNIKPGTEIKTKTKKARRGQKTISDRR